MSVSKRPSLEAVYPSMPNNYNRKTVDMLLSYPMATSTGFNGYNANVGDMRNSGFEFEIRGTAIRTG